MFALNASLTDLGTRIDRMISSLRSTLASWRHVLQVRLRALRDRVLATCQAAVSSTQHATAVLAVTLPILAARLRPLPAPPAALPAAARAYAVLALATLLAGGLGMPIPFVGLLALATGLAKLALIALVLAPVLSWLAAPGRSQSLLHGLRVVTASGVLGLSGLGLLVGEALAPRPTATASTPAPADAVAVPTIRTASRANPVSLTTGAIDPEELLATRGRRSASTPRCRT
jgi:hypothetical protein